MIRVLHLLDSQADFQTQRCVEHLSRELGEGFSTEVRTLGKGGSWRGVVTAVRELRRADFDVVHAWGLGALATAAMAGGAKLLASVDARMWGRRIGWLRAIMSQRPLEVIAPMATQRKALVGRGIPLERCHLIRPGVDFARVKRKRGTELRRQLGLDDADYVLLAAGESEATAGHRDTIWAAAILHVLDPRYKLLLWGRGRGLPEVERFASKLKNPDLIRIAERRLERAVEFEELLSASDMVLINGSDRTPTLPVAISMAAALPIVAAVSYPIGEMLEDRHTALLTPRHAPRKMAQKILQLREDSGLQWSLADMARTEAYEYFSLTRFLNQYRSVYRRLMEGQQVEVIEPAPGAGLRFHGRG